MYIMCILIPGLSIQPYHKLRLFAEDIHMLTCLAG
jgi:hypothetical protein